MDGNSPTWDTSKSAIGERLVAVRKARSFASKDVAAAMGCSTQRWNNYERGNSTPPPELLVRFWHLTGATSDYVLFGRMDGLPFDLVRLLDKRSA